jgi:hypothetical protein
MDDEPTSRSPAPRPGGTVEPLNRAGVAKERFQTPTDTPAERYELRDPFAETTYRSDDFAKMAAKAEHMGSSRFSAIDAQGNRTAVLKVNGRWEKDIPQHVQQRAAAEPAHDGPQPGMGVSAAATERAAPPAPERSTTTVDAQAERAALVARLEAALKERYVIKRAGIVAGAVPLGQTEYRFRGDTSRIAFTESAFRLATDTNSPSVARSMVDVAEARNWKALRVSGNEDFRRLVWLEASVRGVKTVGYEPQPADLDLLKTAREARLVNRVEPAPEGPASEAATKASGRGGGRKAVLAAIEALLVAQRVPEKQREAVMAAATEQLAARTRAGQSFQVKVLDKAAPAHRAPAVARPDPARQRDRASPSR